MIIPIIFVSHWYASLFAQTFFLHRYSAHRMFKLSKFWERFFFIFTYVAQGSSFLNPRAYAILHRLHHVHSDTEKDPHSPVISPNIFKMMWRTKNYYLGVLSKKITVAREFMYGYPTWKGFEQFAEGWISRTFWVTFWTTVYVLAYLYLDMSPWLFVLLPFHFLMGPIHGAIVNWAGHKVGYRNFNNSDNSRNSLFFDFITLGELFQNNHHKLPLRTNFAVRWWEIDPAYWVIRFMNVVGIVRITKTPKPTAQELESAASAQPSHNEVEQALIDKEEREGTPKHSGHSFQANGLPTHQD